MHKNKYELLLGGGLYSFLRISNICVVFCFFCCSDCYTLSILRRTSSSSMDCVKHYRISCLQNSWVYISARNTFPSLQHLVEHYSGWRAVHVALLSCLSILKTEQSRNITDKNVAPFPETADGLCCRLTRPCFIKGLDKAREAKPGPATVRRSTINWKDISRCGRFFPFWWPPTGPSLCWANY